MPTYNSLTDRSDAGALIPEDAARSIIQNSIEQSAVLRRFRRVTLSRAQQRLPVLSAFPTAYFVDGDTGLKQTSKQAWANKYLNVEEIAVIIPIPEAVLDDTDFDLWNEIRPRGAEAIGRTLDAAVFFGVGAPASWPDAIADAVDGAGNEYVRGTNNAAAGGLAEDINGVMATVEADGFDPSGFVTSRGFRWRLRGARDADGNRLMDVGPNGDSVYGLPVDYTMSGLWPTADHRPELFAGDWSQFVVGIRQDITAKILDQAVLTDGDGAVVYNLAQQDMVALRLVMRVAWQVANPMTHDQPTEANRYPAGALVSPSSS